MEALPPEQPEEADHSADHPRQGEQLVGHLERAPVARKQAQAMLHYDTDDKEAAADDADRAHRAGT